MPSKSQLSNKGPATVRVVPYPTSVLLKAFPYKYNKYTRGKSVNEIYGTLV